LIVSTHESHGYRYYTKFALRDLPNDFVSRNDLECIGICREM
jgi:hypothetical protein